MIRIQMIVAGLLCSSSYVDYVHFAQQDVVQQQAICSSMLCSTGCGQYAQQDVVQQQALQSSSYAQRDVVSILNRMWSNSRLCTVAYNYAQQDVVQQQTMHSNI